MTDNTNPGNFANRPKEEVILAASQYQVFSDAFRFKQLPPKAVKPATAVVGVLPQAADLPMFVSLLLLV
jgi:hypothetical protein